VLATYKATAVRGSCGYVKRREESPSQLPAWQAMNSSRASESDCLCAFFFDLKEHRNNIEYYRIDPCLRDDIHKMYV
jgi:hypothetical protein